MRENLLLSDVLGVDDCGCFEKSLNYIAPVSEELRELFGDHTKRHPHMLNECFVRVRPNGRGGTTRQTANGVFTVRTDLDVYKMIVVKVKPKK